MSRHDQRDPAWAASADDVGLDEASDHLLALVGEKPDPDGFLKGLLGLVQGLATPAVACSATAWRDGQPVTVAMSSPLATFADEVHYGLEEGPCLRCLRSGQLVAIPSMASEHRWRDFARRALAQGARCSLSLPLVVRGETVASLNVYATEPQALTGAEQEKLSAFASRAAGCLAVLTSSSSAVEAC